MGVVLTEEKKGVKEGVKEGVREKDVERELGEMRGRRCKMSIILKSDAPN